MTVTPLSSHPSNCPQSQFVSATHLVIIPSYNSEAQLLKTVKSALTQWSPVWVVIDGSNDGSEEAVRAMLQKTPSLHSRLRLFILPHNQGKGAAVFHAMQAALAEGFSHTLCMDADGQHPAQLIPEFMQISQAHLSAMVLGKPIFDDSAPRMRVNGRKISNAWVNLETLWAGIGDSLFGFRVYPIQPLCKIMQTHRWMRRFDFDPEAVVRLSWAGVQPINCPALVRYLSPAEGGVSHFKYLRDNVLLTWMHLRLMGSFLVRLPALLIKRRLVSNS